MNRFLRPVALLSLPLLMAACGGHSSALPQPPGQGTPTNNSVGGAFGQMVAELSNPNVRQNCGAVSVGFARCFSVVRTDVGPDVVPNSNGPYGPADLTSAYKLPSATAGAGQTVAIVDAFDDPTAESDLKIYRSRFHLPPCTTANHCFRKRNQRGLPSPLPPPDAGWAQEISLDVDMVSAICPKCHILLMEGDDNSFVNLALTVKEAAKLHANAISNSYGGGEFGGAPDADYKQPGHMVVASSGDGSFSAGPQFPAASEWVTSVGGTSLFRGGGGSRGWHESVWSGAGSGCSTVFTKPSWQHDPSCHKRMIADVSADADPNTGVFVIYSGSLFVFGGTSVSSPIIASVYALAGNSSTLNYASFGYAHTNKLFDVTTGANGVCSPAYFCHGEVGYDGPTGNGTPNGTGAF